MTTTPDAVQGGRRLRNMRDKQSRIFEAAAALFAEHGFASVTTQQISERADVAAGTLFRYAASKGELLLMVCNEEFRAALDQGERDAKAESDPSRAVLAMTRPILEAADQHVENTVAYQRELLFGAPTEQYRAKGLATVARLESMIAERLTAAVTLRDADPKAVFARALLAGRSVFAVLHLILARPSTGAHSGRDAIDDLRDQITQIVAGFFASVE
ncbi:TetR/AcrR family transcriptional regulator [Nocardia sp. NPDC051052]|uniref:TetR/AcrR family transcriptional regulator n=1 Tax=Nocardia sp. NPDC051052 TaxID=3364322 RepID=UPI0037B7DCAB